MSIPLPKPIVDVVRAARAVVHAKTELRSALDGEINDAGITKRRKALRAAIAQLEKAVHALEVLIDRGKARKAKGGEPINWNALLGAAGEFVGLVARVKAGESGPGVAGGAMRWANKHGPSSKRPASDDIIEGEIIE